MAREAENMAQPARRGKESIKELVFSVVRGVRNIPVAMGKRDRVGHPQLGQQL